MNINEKTNQVENNLKSRQQKQKGAGAVEYALVLAVVVTLVVGLSGNMQDGLTEFFEAAVAKVSEFMG